MKKRNFGRYRLELTHLTKVFFPDSHLTKGDLVNYYEEIADILLPHIRDRPLTLHRFPDGIIKEGFFQQSRSDYFPDWLPGLEIEHGGETGRVQHVACDHPACLVYLANQGTITLHRWLSRTRHLKQPDMIIFDLDPPGNDFEAVRKGAWKVGQGMREAGMTPYVMTTGSRGLHVVAPLRPEAGFDQVREAAQTLARWLGEHYPDELTTEQRKNKRRGRLYLDVMRNAFGQTAVAPYTVRAKPKAPVATPLDWDELDDPELDAQSYNATNIFQRLAQKGDPWRDMRRRAIKPDTLRKSMEKMGS